MTTLALVTMLLAWSYILFMVVYFFSKLIRKERAKRRAIQQDEPGEKIAN
ncbi:MAG: hypothetical protein HW412_563 [Bacteroidetes bacterium]|nr:hypothetical protein [Bacteroidota bacterium]